MVANIVLILGDQLSPGMSSLRAAGRDDSVVVMAEVMAEARYVRHHRKKIAFLFAAMRHFAAELVADGWRVDYVTIDDPANSGTLAGEVDRARRRHKVERVIVTEPGEWRLAKEMRAWPATRILADDRFIASHQDFRDWAGSRKALRMEYFYREMRQRTGLLMADGAPLGGRWNFDTENRKSPDPGIAPPAPLHFPADAITADVLESVARLFPDHFGDLTPFWFATTRAQARAALDHFIATALPRFGDYQDAMLKGQKFLFHSVLSLYLNCGLLDPLEICRAAEQAYRAGAAPLNAVEGFIRQIIGWREFIRGVYWLKMPGYRAMNALAATRPLPGFYWSAQTDMACVAACVTQTREEAYAHHIQRLMVTGNFALLAGIDPHELHEWYLAVYADAYEWVELPNTLGMSQFADGGIVGSKPYAASGAYINRMSDYCKSCRYDVDARTGETACPFNYLYWDFIDRHRDRLVANPRMAQIVRGWDKAPPERKEAVRTSAARFLAALR